MLTWVIAGSLVLGAPARKDKPAGQELYGEWVVEAQEENGRARPPEEVPTRLRFDKDRTCQVDLGGKGWSEPRGFKFDPAADPPTLDLNTSRAGPANPLILAVYRVDGDRLTVCQAGPGRARPADLASPPGSDRLLIKLRRVKPKD